MSPSSTNTALNQNLHSLRRTALRWGCPACYPQFFVYAPSHLVRVPHVPRLAGLLCVQTVLPVSALSRADINALLAEKGFAMAAVVQPPPTNDVATEL